ncbi:uncharacterized protein LOC111274234 [Durio zibethinus]|uniref:Uncharacterized protein LOC111274234 n=1 Tax=Durio zibethinus TaxID=66656 RepID=A0A6P5WEW1_DURZI|nr:uncharacterized protein LOC111274234 [Durio zibethinus]
MDSITGIQNILHLFYSYSGLQLNNAKSELFSSKIQRQELLEILQETGFKHGTLPVRYLSVALVTRKLTANSAKGARVRWQIICSLKPEGDLGLKDLLTWNQACILKHLWSLSSQVGSIWIAWIHIYVLKGQSLWEMPISKGTSWCMKKLLQLKVLLPGSWCKQKKVWLIWCKFHISKCTVIAWMAILNKLPTKDRLTSWGIANEGGCVLCSQETESRNHIIFSCSYSKTVWKGVLRLCNLHKEVAGWENEL